ncbi:unnamed protein product [Rotaria socialis]|uniref:Uncharacterized protein n=1 Tax=Rotaria socialis TaxID=392032 RepID=A0A818ZHC5_9BILA|nr:unnamed protein product [Rotaria socialis]
MGPKKRRQQNNKENRDDNVKNAKLDPISIQSIVDQNLEQFEADFQQQYKQCENKIQEKLTFVHKEFDKYMQTHEAQGKLARLLDQQITRINQHQQQQADGSLVSSCQELLDKTNDLMNASSSDTSRTKTYLIGELKMLPRGHVFTLYSIIFSSLTHSRIRQNPGITLHYSYYKIKFDSSSSSSIMILRLLVAYLFLFFISFQYSYEMSTSTNGMSTNKYNHDLFLLVKSLHLISRLCQKQRQYPLNITKLCLRCFPSDSLQKQEQRSKRVGWTISV